MGYLLRPIGIAVAASLILAACGGGDAEESNVVLDTTTTTADPSSQSADTSTSELDPASTSSTVVSTTTVEVIDDASTTTAPQAGQGTTLTDAARISTLGLGPVYMGDTIEEVAEKIGVTLDPDEFGNDTCRFHAAPGGPPGVAFMVSFGRISRIDISSPSTITTRSGAGIGSTKQEILDLFGAKIEVSPHQYTDGEYLTFVPTDDKDQNLRIVFETDENGVVNTYRTGQLPEVEFVEGCA